MAQIEDSNNDPLFSDQITATIELPLENATNLVDETESEDSDESQYSDYLSCRLTRSRDPRFRAGQRESGRLGPRIVELTPKQLSDMGLEQPKSGQTDRLRNGDAFNSGELERFRSRTGEWRRVSGPISISNANRACYKMGFELGAESVKENVVTCKLLPGCPEGWVGARGMCYLPIPVAATNEGAHFRCNKLGARLLSIGDHRENHIISEMLLKHMPDHPFWHMGGSKQLFARNYEWDDPPRPMIYKNWFPGWKPHGLGRKPGPDILFDHCVTLERKYRVPGAPVAQVAIGSTEYFFWSNPPCSTKLPFICAKLPDKSGSCYRGNGEAYRGRILRTQAGTNCLKWSDNPHINPETHPGTGLGSHSFCRNPDSSDAPWCWVDHEKSLFSYCAVDKCSDTLTTAAPPPSTTSPTDVSPEAPASNTTCRHNEVACNSTDICIENDWVCDGKKDCDAGEDEKDCNSWLEHFTDSDIGRYHVENYKMEAYLNYTVEQCAKACVDEVGFVCRAINFHERSGRCELTEANTAMAGGPEPKPQWKAYQLKSQMLNCTGLHQCPNGKCIEMTRVCDRNNDCNDLSDEKNCTSEEGSYDKLRLVGGRTEKEGNVQVYYKGKWYPICDDGWRLNEAEVACRQLGYAGAERFYMNSFFGNAPKKAAFILDEVSCQGNETLLSECNHAPLGENDCGVSEAAGVRCRNVKEACPGESQGQVFRCDNGECVDLVDVCDGDLDCLDASDEKQCNGIAVRLEGGESSGRVGIRRNGVWGTICGADWTNDDAAVVCNMLGFKGSSEVLRPNGVGPGSGPVWLGFPGCTGTEVHLDECPGLRWGSARCKDHSTDAGVTCSNTVINTTEPSVESLLPKECGNRAIENRRPRVVGGFTATHGGFPWLVNIMRRPYGRMRPIHHCGGTIISENWVVTAAHCIYELTKRELVIVAGDHTLYRTEAVEQRRNVNLMVVPWAYSGARKPLLFWLYPESGTDYDIALLRLSSPLRFTRYVQPACLPDDEQLYTPGEVCQLAGWGRLKQGGSKAKVLQALDVPILPPKFCSRVYKQMLSSRMFCAGRVEGGVDSCQGDSGGPLTCTDTKGRNFLGGVVSWGYGCAKPMQPGVYVHVLEMRDWIIRVLSKYSV